MSVISSVIDSVVEGVVVSQGGIYTPYVPTSPPADVQGDLVAYYSFGNEYTLSTGYTGNLYYVGVKSSVQDFSGSGNNATPPNTTMTVVGQNDEVHALGNNVAFTGTEVITAPAMTAETGTLEVWVRPPNEAATQYSLVESTGLLLEIDASGFASFTANATTVVGTTDLSDGAWHHIVAMWGVGGMSITVDDTEEDTDVLETVLTATSADWTIGGLTNQFIGDMLEVALWKKQLSGAEVTARYAAGAGAQIVAGPSIDTFRADKMIYTDSETPTFTLDVTNDQAYTDAHVEVIVERGLDEAITVYGETTQLTSGAQSVPFSWAMTVNGLNNNMQGCLAKCTIRNSAGNTIAYAEAQFDVVDEWWKSLRYQNMLAGTHAISGVTDNTLDGFSNRARKWNINGIELFKYSPPWNLAPPIALSEWDNMHSPSLIQRDRVEYLGTALASRGMKYMLYMEAQAIRDLSDFSTPVPEMWKVFNTSVPGDEDYYVRWHETDGYVVPNLNYIASASNTTDRNYLSDAFIDAQADFGFDGAYMDGAALLGWLVTKTGGDAKYSGDGIIIDGNPHTEFGDWGEQWLEDTFTDNVWQNASTANFYILTNNFYPAVTSTPTAIGVAIADIYDNITTKVSSMEMTLVSDIHQAGTYEGDPQNTPSGSYSQIYSEQQAILAAMKDNLGSMFMWAYCTAVNKATPANNLAWSRPKIANMLASGWYFHEGNCITEGLLDWNSQYEADSQVHAQALRFWGRYSKWITAGDFNYVHPDATSATDPNDLFTITASKTLEWDYGVWTRERDSLTEYVIHIQNLPADDTIEGQTSIPAIADTVSLGIKKVTGHGYDVFTLDADDAVLTPVELSIATDAGGYQYYTLPDIRAYQVVVLRENTEDVPAMELIIHDTFTDTVDTLIENHVIAPTNTPTGFWEIPSGGGKISSNRCYGTGASHNHIIKETGVSDFELTCTFSPYGTTQYQGFTFRFSDLTDQVWAALDNADVANPSLVIIRREGGVNTTVAETPLTGLGPIGGSTQARLTVNGSSIKFEFLVDGTWYTVEATESFNLTETKHGLRPYNVNGWYDDLMICEITS